MDNNHPMYFGCPGIYGNRAANKILHNATEIIAVGNRMAIWNVGHAGPRDGQNVYMVDLDEAEAAKCPSATLIAQDCRYFLWRHPVASHEYRQEIASWVDQCRRWREAHPWVEPGTHDDANHCINAYRFTDALQKHFARDEHIVTDMGTALICAHQVLKLKPPQRLMTSGGLGEMGCALPAAVGVSVARGNGRVICLSTDGGMMLNLQELQTIVHHQLPVKIIVYRNEGYLMIRHTQKASGLCEAGVAPDSGVSFPSYRHVALAFGISACEVRTWEDFDRIIPSFISCDGPGLLEFHMDPRQPLVPKLEYEFVDGKQQYARFDRMSPQERAHA